MFIGLPDSWGEVVFTHRTPESPLLYELANNTLSNPNLFVAHQR